MQLNRSNCGSMNIAAKIALEVQIKAIRTAIDFYINKEREYIQDISYVGKQMLGHCEGQRFILEKQLIILQNELQKVDYND